MEKVILNEKELEAVTGGKKKTNQTVNVSGIPFLGDKSAAELIALWNGASAFEKSLVKSTAKSEPSLISQFVSEVIAAGLQAQVPADMKAALGITAF